jgi:uncharacterized protein (DUF1501 family)
MRTRAAHFRQRHWDTAGPGLSTTKDGWHGISEVPVDPLAGWSATQELPRALSGDVSVPAIPNAATYAFNSPNGGAEAINERASATRIASHLQDERPHLSIVNKSAQGAFATLDRVSSVAAYTGTVPYPNNGFALALRTVAGAIVRGIGTRVFWVQTGGYDTHAGQGAGGAGAYEPHGVCDGLAAFYNDSGIRTGERHACSQFSEFGRRVFENGSGGPTGGGCRDVALGRMVRGGICTPRPQLDPSQ